MLLASFAAAIFVSAALLFAGAADVHQDGAAALRRRAGGVVGGDRVLPGRAARGLCLRPSADALRCPAGRSVVIHLAVMVAAVLRAAAVDRRRLGPAAGGRRSVLADRPVRGLDRPAVLRALRQRPLLQAWFARTDHPAANDPYFLYAGSNVGSFLALLSYPVVVEPFVRLGDQTRLWSVGFYLLIALIAGCGVLLWRSPDKAADAATDTAAEAAPPTWRDAAFWVALAAVPSGLLVAVTAHISTDVAAVPLLWVLPLALYLLTFVIVFARRPIIPHWLVVDGPAAVRDRLALLIFDLKTNSMDRRARLRAAQDHRRADRRASRGVLRLRADVPRRARAPAAAAAIPHRLLSVDVGGRHDRRHRGRADCAPRVQLGGGISDPDRARGALPAGLAAAAGPTLALSACCSRLAAAVLAPDLLRDRHRAIDRDAPSTGSFRAAGRRSVLFWRAPLPLRRDRRLRADRQSQRVRAGGRDVRAQLLRRRQDHREQRRPVPPAAARHHAAWRPAHPRRRRTAGHRTAGAPALLLRRLRHRAGVRGGAGAHRRPDPLCGDRARHRHRSPAAPSRRTPCTTTRSTRPIIRDRPRSESVHLPVDMPARRADHARRCPAHARPRRPTAPTTSSSSMPSRPTPSPSTCSRAKRWRSI